MQKTKVLIFGLIFILNSLGIFAQKAESKVIDEIIAVIGNKMVLESSVQNQILQYQAQGYYTGPEMRCQIFEELLYQKLLVNQAQIDSIEVTDKEVEQNLEARIRQFLAQFGGSIEKLEEYFGKPLAEIKTEFKDVIREQLTVQKMQNEIAGEIKITPSEVKNYYKNLPKDSLPIIPETYELGQVMVYPPVSEDDIKAVKEKMNGMRERIKNGEKFSTLAVLYSEDPGSAKKGGDLGFVSRGELVPEFAAVAFNLKPGEVSRLVETDFGFHIIKMEERRGEKVRVRHILMSPKVKPEAKLKAASFLDSVLVLIRTDTLSFDDAALKFSDDKNTKNNGGLMINPYNGTSKFEKKHIDPATNYVVQKLKVGQISDPFEGADDRGKAAYKIIVLKSKTPQHIANINDDYQFLREKALQAKKMKIVDEWIEKKQRETYIKIKENYRDCEFNYTGWLR